MLKYEFKNKNYLLIGAAKELGRILSLELAESKANLFLLDIDPKLNDLGKILSKKTKCKTHICDLTHYDQVADHLSGWITGGLDGIVYFTRGRQKFSYSDLDHEKWSADLRLNVEAIMHIVHRLWKEKKINKEASIVFLSSVLSEHPGLESISYSMSKSALESMCRYLAVEMGGQNVRVNTIRFGHYVKDEHKKRFYSKDNKDYRFWLENVQPLKRVAHNEDIVGPIKFLLSKDSAFMTGQTLCIDGGVTLREAAKLIWDYQQETGKRNGS